MREMGFGRILSAFQLFSFTSRTRKVKVESESANRGRAETGSERRPSLGKAEKKPEGACTNEEGGVAGTASKRPPVPFPIKRAWLMSGA